jgi:hypothetical protein
MNGVFLKYSIIQFLLLEYNIIFLNWHFGVSNMTTQHVLQDCVARTDRHRRLLPTPVTFDKNRME